jgi:hypothetical protein
MRVAKTTRPSEMPGATKSVAPSDYLSCRRFLVSLALRNHLVHGLLNREQQYFVEFRVAADSATVPSGGWPSLLSKANPPLRPR